MSPAPEIVRRYARAHLVSVMLLIFLACALYGKSVTHLFIENWDDNYYVTANPDIAGFSLEHLNHAFTRFYSGNYAPLHIISYMLDYSFWGLNPGAFKLVNLALHVANALLYYALLIRLTGRRLTALAAAVIFLCHPVQVESVAWISQRKNVLAMFFFLISFLSYAHWKDTRRPLVYLVSLLAFTLALLSKSVAVVLPLCLICHDLCFREREPLRQLARDQAPYLLLATACSLMAYFSQGADGGRTGYLGGSALITVLNMLPVISSYLVMLFAPLQLSIIYNSPIKAGVDSDVILSALLVVLLFGAMCSLFCRDRRLFFWGALFFIGILPVANIIPLVTLMNDRYLYFPMLGFAGFMSVVLVTPGSNRRMQGVIATMVLSWLALLSVLTWYRVDVWRDSLTLWRDALEHSQDGYRYGAGKNFIAASYAGALSARGYWAEEQHDLAVARRYYLLALCYDPDESQALTNLGGIETRQGRPLAGRPYLIRVTRVYLHDDMGFFNLGINYSKTGELEKAAENFRRALEINPANEMASGALERVEKKRITLLP